MHLVSWILRIAISGTFFGHGYLAFKVNEGWIHYITYWGFSYEAATYIMPVIGMIDFFVAVAVIIKPFRYILWWAFIWAFATALMRWVADANIIAFIERTANWCVPLALLFLQRNRSS